MITQADTITQQEKLRDIVSNLPTLVLLFIIQPDDHLSHNLIRSELYERLDWSDFRNRYTELNGLSQDEFERDYADEWLSC